MSIDRVGFLLCMRPAEAEFFEVLLNGFQPASTRQVGSLVQLRKEIDRIDGRVRLISFCSNFIVPAGVIADLGGECFNFHPGPPERPGYRPAAFAAAEHARSFGVTFHSMSAEADAGAIYALRRFPVDDPADEESIAVAAYGHLMWLAAEVASRLGNPKHRFEHLPIAWGPTVTTRRDYLTLCSSRTERLAVAGSASGSARLLAAMRRSDDASGHSTKDG